VGLTDKQAVRGWLKGFEQEVLLAGSAVSAANLYKDGSTGLLNLVCSDVTCNGEIANPHGNYAEQPCFYSHLCRVQAGMFEDQTQGQSFCITSKTFH
jgi:hypothetical protein